MTDDAKISFTCVACGATGRIPVAYRGRNARCPECKHVQTIPADAPFASDTGTGRIELPKITTSIPRAGGAAAPAVGSGAAAIGPATRRLRSQRPDMVIGSEGGVGTPGAIPTPRPGASPMPMPTPLPERLARGPQADEMRALGARLDELQAILATLRQDQDRQQARLSGFGEQLTSIESRPAPAAAPASAPAIDLTETEQRLTVLEDGIRGLRSQLQELAERPLPTPPAPKVVKQGGGALAAVAMSVGTLGLLAGGYAAYMGQVQQKQTDERLGVLASKSDLNEAKADTQKLTTALSNLQGSVVTAEDTARKLTESIGGLGTRLDGSETRLTELNAQLGRAEEARTALTRQIEELRSSLPRLPGR
jgi:hypothetical protein